MLFQSWDTGGISKSDKKLRSHTRKSQRKIWIQTELKSCSGKDIIKDRTDFHFWSSWSNWTGLFAVSNMKWVFSDKGQQAEQNCDLSSWIRTHTEPITPLSFLLESLSRPQHREQGPIQGTILTLSWRDKDGRLRRQSVLEFSEEYDGEGAMQRKSSRNLLRVPCVYIGGDSTGRAKHCCRNSHSKLSWQKPESLEGWRGARDKAKVRDTPLRVNSLKMRCSQPQERNTILEWFKDLESSSSPICKKGNSENSQDGYDVLRTWTIYGFPVIGVKPLLFFNKLITCS